MSDRPGSVMSGVTVVIPNWNRRGPLERLIGQLQAQTRPPEEILVVDNGSSDGSAEAARSRGARVIELDRNAGFAVAVNRGIEETRTELVAVINNDVEPAPDWLERLGEALEQPQVWFASGRLRSAARPEELDGTYDTLCRGACPWRAGHGAKDGPPWGRRRRIRFAPFTAALFRTELFHRVGALDERFQSYLEDVEFCLRCAKLGYAGLYVPDALATHAGSATLGRWHKDAVRLIARNQVLLMAKHYPAGCLLRYGWPILVAQGLWGLLAMAHGRGLPFLRGKLEGLLLARTVRREAARGGGFEPGLSRILEESESEIFRLQRRQGFDLYWRLYFALTSLV
ncbi:MAG: glycosyltransferase family 2 protein [Bryobacteraceae bacterium]